MEKYEGTLRACGWLGGVENPTRPLFGNTGLTWRGDGDHQPAEVFLGSHGALGGVGWKVVVEDNTCEQQVAEFMSQHLVARGVEAALTAFEPIGEGAAETHPFALEKWLMDNIYEFTLKTADKSVADRVHHAMQQVHDFTHGVQASGPAAS